jgi:hypothetical protein
MQGEGRSVWFETAALDLWYRRRLLTTNGFKAMLIKWLSFVANPLLRSW